LARYIFNSGTAFRHVEHPDFIEFVKYLRPSFKPPSRKIVATELLDNEYNQVKAVVDEKIAKAPYLSLQLDGWTNIW
jgi:hypothetical protein